MLWPLCLKKEPACRHSEVDAITVSSLGCDREMRLSYRGESRQIIHLQFALISFGADLQCFCHARLRHLASDTQIGLMGFHQKSLRHGTKCSNIHGRLGVSDGMRRKRGNAAGQLLDKTRQLVRRQCSINIAVTFCQLRREIIATYEHLQGASPPDEPRQSLRRAAARNKPNRHLWLTEDRFANGSKTHVHGQRDLAPSAPSPSLDFGNGYLGHVPEPLADRLCKTKATRMRHRFGNGSNPAQARVGYKEIRKRALQD